MGKGVYLFRVFFLCIVSGVFAQAPANYNKIEFVYQQRTNYNIQKEGFFADTLLLKIDFPNLKYDLLNDPDDVSRKVGYVAFRQMTSTQKKRFYGIVEHSEHNIYGVYDAKTKILSLTHKRLNVKWQWNSSKDYNIMQIFLQRPMFESENPNTVVYDDNQKLSGKYKVKGREWLYENIVIFDADLPKFVATDDAYFDGEFGIKKIISMHSTTELVSIKYN